MASESMYSTWTPRLLSVLRIIVGFLFLQHGAQKLFGFPAPFEGPTPLPYILLAAGILEFFGGLMIMIGLFTRPVAFLLSGQMAAAYFMGHAKNGFYPMLNGGELAVLYCFIFLYLCSAGGGPWSVDALLKRK